MQQVLNRYSADEFLIKSREWNAVSENAAHAIPKKRL